MQSLLTEYAKCTLGSVVFIVQVHYLVYILHKITVHSLVNLCIDIVHLLVYYNGIKSINNIFLRRFFNMKTYKIYVHGDLVGIEKLSSEEVRAMNNCSEIRLITM